MIQAKVKSIWDGGRRGFKSKQLGLKRQLDSSVAELKSILEIDLPIIHHQLHARFSKSNLTILNDGIGGWIRWID